MKNIWIVVFVILGNILHAQNDSLQNNFPPTIEHQNYLPDSLPTATTIGTDSLPEKKKKVFFLKKFIKDDYPSPRKAAILSLALPGAGQIYNKKHWYIKLPIIYGGLGFLVYSIDFNNRNYKDLRAEYKLMVDDDETTISRFELAGVPASTIKQFRDQFDKRLQLSWIGLVAGYILVATESYVTAHLLSFDINDDLGMQISPNFEILPHQQTTMGIGINFNLKNKPTPKPKVFLVQP